MKRTDARALSSSNQEDLRIRAVYMVIHEGMKVTEAAATFGIARGTLSKWLSAYRRRGEAGLESARRGRPVGSGRLKPWQAAWICNKIRDRCPDQLKLPWALWTRDAVLALMKRQFGVTMTRQALSRHLERWGFTAQRPARQALERDAAAVKQWLAKEYPALKRRAKKEGAAIFWSDESGIRSTDFRGRGFSPKGQAPILKTTGRRFGCNFIAAIDRYGQMAFRVFDGTLTAAVFIDFLERLIRHSAVERAGKVILIVDRHSVHRSAAVRRFVEAHADQIELAFLPAYSPDMNPSEILNQDLKVGIRHKARGTLQELKSSVRAHLHSRQKTPQVVRAFFHAPSVRYAS